MRLLPFWVGACLLAIIITPANAKHYHRTTTVTLAPECNIIMPCDGAFYTPRAKKFIGIPFGQPVQSYQSQRPVRQDVPDRHRKFAEVKYKTTVLTNKHRVQNNITSRENSVIGGKPEGCPRLFCGCGASLKIFGKIIPELNLASNWLKFPHVSHSQAQPGMAAATYGHVMVLVEHKHDDIWLVHDSNSGGGLTRLHEVSIGRYTVVNPHG